MKSIYRGDRTQYNFHRILHHIWQNEGISQKDLCESLGLDKATMSNMVSFIEHQGLIRKVPTCQTQNKPGRRPIGLEIRDDIGYVIGAELLGDRIKFQISDSRFQKILSKDFTIKTHADVLKENFLQCIQEIEQLPELKELFLLGIGVAVPGIVDTDSGIILHSFELGMEEEPYPFKEIMERHISCPVYLDNNANCCARNILVGQRKKVQSHFLLAYFGFDDTDGPYQKPVDHPSLGLGFVINGDIYSGPEGSAGEFKSVNSNVEYMNQFSIPREDLKKYKKDLDVQERLARDLAAHLAFLLNVFNFKEIYLGGDLKYLHPDFTLFLDKATYKNWPYPGRVNYALNILEKSDDLAGMGASALVLQHFFSVPDPNTPQKNAYWNNLPGEASIGLKEGS